MTFCFLELNLVMVTHVWPPPIKSDHGRNKACAQKVTLTWPPPDKSDHIATSFKGCEVTPAWPPPHKSDHSKNQAREARAHVCALTPSPAPSFPHSVPHSLHPHARAPLPFPGSAAAPTTATEAAPTAAAAATPAAACFPCCCALLRLRRVSLCVDCH